MEEEKLVELSQYEIRIDFALGSKCRTNIHLKSLISTAPIAFKVQTSSPHKFLVNPPTGFLPPLSTLTFQIVLKPQSQLPPTFPRSPSDRFLLKTALISDFPESAQPEVIYRWFNGRRTYDVKLKVYFIGRFLLCHAATAGDFDAVKGIIKRHRSVVSELGSGEAESLYRVASQYPAVMGLLLEAGLRVEAEMRRDDLRWASRGWTELHVAAAFGRREEVERAVRVEAVDSRDKEGRAALNLAAGKGHLEIAKVLVSAGANVDARSKDGRTALYRAAANGDLPMVVMLLSAGADPTIGDVDHCRSAIDVARDKAHIEIVKIMERGKAVIDAARRGEIEGLEMILEKGASTKLCDEYGMSALHVAAIKGNKEVVMMLVEYGSDLELGDMEGHTPLHLAVQAGSLDTVEILIDRGAKVNAVTNKGATPLYISRLMEHHHIAQLLLHKGAT